MDWDWGLGTAGLQPKSGRGQDWGRSKSGTGVGVADGSGKR